jgi:hypothetical protein
MHQTGHTLIKARLIGDLNPEDWELPPKPRWMRWATYGTSSGSMSMRKRSTTLQSRRQVKGWD